MKESVRLAVSSLLDRLGVDYPNMTDENAETYLGFVLKQEYALAANKFNAFSEYVGRVTLLEMEYGISKDDAVEYGFIIQAAMQARES